MFQGKDWSYTTPSYPPCLLSTLITHYTQHLYKVHPRGTGSLKHCLHDPDHKGDKNYDSKDSEDEHDDATTATLNDITRQDLLGAAEETREIATNNPKYQYNETNGRYKDDDADNQVPHDQ